MNGMKKVNVEKRTLLCLLRALDFLSIFVFIWVLKLDVW